jgi:hypothetical protein
MLDIQPTLPERETQFYEILQKIEDVIRRETDSFLSVQQRTKFTVFLKTLLREKKYVFEWMRERDIPIPSVNIQPLERRSIYTDCSILMMKDGKLVIECYNVSFDDSVQEEPFYWQINRSFFEPIDSDIEHLLSMKVQDEETFQAFLTYYQTL